MDKIEEPQQPLRVNDLEQSGQDVLGKPLYVEFLGTDRNGKVYFPVYSTTDYLVCINPSSTSMRFELFPKDMEFASIVSRNGLSASANDYVNRDETLVSVLRKKASIFESISCTHAFTECMALFPNETIQVLNGDITLKDLPNVLEIGRLVNAVNTVKSNVRRLNADLKGLVRSQNFSAVSQFKEAIELEKSKLRPNEEEIQKRERFVRILSENLPVFRAKAASCLVGNDNAKVLGKSEYPVGTIIESEISMIDNLVVTMEYKGEIIRGIIIGARKISEGIVPVFAIEGDGYNLGYDPKIRIVSWGLDPKAFEKIKGESMFIKARKDLEIRRYDEISKLFGFNLEVSRQICQMFLEAYDEPAVQNQFAKTQFTEHQRNILARDMWTMKAQTRVLDALVEGQIEDRLAVDLLKTLDELRKNH